MLGILLDDRYYQQYSRRRLDHLLAPSRFGVQVRAGDDLGWGSRQGAAHIGAYLQVMAELGIPSNEPLRLADGAPHTLAEVVTDEARRAHLKSELPWLVVGLAAYLENPTWQNRFDQPISFDDLARELLAKAIGEGPCFGTHTPYALALLANFDDQAGILSSTVRDSVTRGLREYSSRVALAQRADGSWGPQWAGETGASTRADSEIDAITATGHHLEWMVFCRPEIRPSDRVLRKCERFLVDRLRYQMQRRNADWHFYLPLSHAVRAVLLANGYRWPTDLKDWQTVLVKTSDMNRG